MNASKAVAKVYATFDHLEEVRSELEKELSELGKLRRSFRWWYRVFCTVTNPLIRYICLAKMDACDRTRLEEWKFKDLVKDFASTLCYQPVSVEPPIGAALLF